MLVMSLVIAILGYIGYLVDDPRRARQPYDALTSIAGGDEEVPALLQAAADLLSPALSV